MEEQRSHGCVEEPHIHLLMKHTCVGGAPGEEPEDVLEEDERQPAAHICAAGLSAGDVEALGGFCSADEEVKAVGRSRSFLLV